MQGAQVESVPVGNSGVQEKTSIGDGVDLKGAKDETVQVANSGMHKELGTSGIEIAMKAATLPESSYKILMPRGGWSKAISYLNDLRETKQQPSQKLVKQVGTSCDFKQIDHVRLVQRLLHTKEPQIFAEDPRAVRGDGTDWNRKELSLLGDVSIAVPVTVFDNGAHVGPVVHPEPFSGTLLYTCGALLRPDGTSADWQELVSKDSTLDEQAYFEIYERRLFPCFQYANDCAKKLGRKALITIPGLGCGQFAGRFMGSLGEKLCAVLQKILERHGHKWLSIHVVYFDAFKEGVPRREVIKDTNIIYIVQPLGKSGPKGRCQLCHPRDFQGAVEGEGDDFSSCDLYSFVAWDHVSWPGNDYWVGNRETDDGVKAAATDSMYKLSGMEGRYDTKLKMYLPPEGYDSWRAVLQKNNIRLDVDSLKDDEASLEGEWQRQCGTKFKIELSSDTLSCSGGQFGKVEFRPPRTVEYMGVSGDYDGTLVKFANGTVWTKLQGSLASPCESVACLKELDPGQNEAAWDNCDDSTDSEGDPVLERNGSRGPSPSAQERRFAEDGNAYTKAEFMNYFGSEEGERKWATALPKDMQLDGSSGPLIIGPDLARLPSRPGGYGWIRSGNAHNDRSLRRLATYQTKSAWQRGYTLDLKDQKHTVTCKCIDDMVRGTMFIRSGGCKLEASPGEAKSETEIKTMGGFSMNVAMQNAIGGARVVTINAASAYHVGGGFETGGRHALEESMCVQSTLFLSLKGAAKLAKEEKIRPSKIAVKNWLSMTQPSDITRDQSSKSSGKSLRRTGTPRQERTPGQGENSENATTGNVDPDMTASPRPPSVTRAITAGDKVLMTGITQKPEMNDTPCTVVSWDAKAAKWVVELEGGAKARLDANNLVLQPVNATTDGELDKKVVAGPIANGLLRKSPRPVQGQTPRSRHNKRRGWLECHIPDDGAIVSPSVEVFRGPSMEGYPFLEKPITVNVVSVAFPNCNPNCRDSPVDRPFGQADYEKLLRSKTIAMFAAAKVLDAEVVVVPSIGCGVFQNDPQLVGFIVGDVLRSNFRNVFKRVLVVDTERFGASALSAAKGEAPKAVIAVAPAPFKKGDKKQIIGLGARLNGQICTIEKWDEASRQWIVEFQGKRHLLAEDNMMAPDLLG